MLVWCGLLCLYDFLKYLVIFLVASKNSAIWSGLLVETDNWTKWTVVGLGYCDQYANL